MKKLIASAAVGTLLVAGLFFTFDNSTDQARDIEPSIFSISNTVF